MRGAIPSLPQYAFIAWSSVKAQGHLYNIYLCFVSIVTSDIFSELRKIIILTSPLITGIKSENTGRKVGILRSTVIHFTFIPLLLIFLVLFPLKIPVSFASVLRIIFSHFRHNVISYGIPFLKAGIRFCEYLKSGVKCHTGDY
jgi:hypothetical protein